MVIIIDQRSFEWNQIKLSRQIKMMLRLQSVDNNIKGRLALVTGSRCVNPIVTACIIELTLIVAE